MKTYSPAVRFAKLHFPHQLALVLFLALMLAFVVGCSRPPQPKTDSAISTQIKTALAGDANLKAVDVDANGGVVILKGRVESDEAKNRVQEIAQKVPGVTWVQNLISVGPRSG